MILGVQNTLENGLWGWGRRDLTAQGQKQSRGLARAGDCGIWEQTSALVSFPCRDRDLLLSVLACFRHNSQRKAMPVTQTNAQSLWRSCVLPQASCGISHELFNFLVPLFLVYKMRIKLCPTLQKHCKESLIYVRQANIPRERRAIYALTNEHLSSSTLRKLTVI